MSSKLDPADEARIETRRAEAMRLRIRGKNYREIAAETGVSVRQAWLDVKAVLERTKNDADEKAEDARALDLDRLDRALDTVEQILEGGSFTEGTDPDELKLKALDRLVKIQEQRAKLLGLYAPQKTELSGPNGGPIAVDARTELLERIAGRARAQDEPGGAGSSPGEPERGGGEDTPA